MTIPPESFQALSERLHAMRGAPTLPADLAVSIPVNAKADLEQVYYLLSDLARYDGTHRIEIILVVNNYPDEQPPDFIELYEQIGARVVAIPNVRRPGEPPGFTARLAGARAAASDAVVSFDADCRVPHPGKLLDWYIAQFRANAAAAYTHVGYFDLRPGLVVKARLFAHHGARWIKRRLLGVPTTRGSNYAIRKSFVLPLYEAGFLADELNVGPVTKRRGGRVAYSGKRELHVLTSGRFLSGGWADLVRYLWYRLKYNLRTIPVRRNAAGRTKRS